MEIAKNIIEAVNGQRQETVVKLRWPVEKVEISLKEKELEKGLLEIESVLKLMCNTEKIVFTKLGKGKEFKEGLVQVGKPLKDEALVRELVRRTQELRKQSNLQVSDTIEAHFNSDKATLDILKKFEKELLAGVGAKKILFKEIKDKKGELEFEDKKVDIGFIKT